MNSPQPTNSSLSSSSINNNNNNNLSSIINNNKNTSASSRINNTSNRNTGSTTNTSRQNNAVNKNSAGIAGTANSNRQNNARNKNSAGNANTIRQNNVASTNRQNNAGNKNSTGNANTTRQNNAGNKNSTSTANTNRQNNAGNNSTPIVQTMTLNSLKNSISETTEKMSPLTIFIIVLILIVLLYISVNYVYAQIISSRDIKVSKNVLLDVITDGMTELEIGASQMPNSSYSNEYSLSMWVYVDNFDYKHGERKVILRRGDIKSVVNPEIYIHPTQNKLQVNVSLATDMTGTPTEGVTTTTTPTTTVPTTTSASTFQNIETFQNNNNNTGANANSNSNVSTVSDPEFINNMSQNYAVETFTDMVNDNSVPQDSSQPSPVTSIKHNQELDVVLEQFGSTDEGCDCEGSGTLTESESDRTAFEEKCGKCFVDNFSLQKWVHLVVSQYNNVIDIYVDGKLSSSCSLPGFPDVSTGSLVLSPEGGFSGQMSSIVYVNSAMTQDDVYKMYVKGPEGSRNEGLISKVKSIPSWVYIVIVLMIVVLVVYSFFM
jgi:hypothetical protein